MNTGQNYARVKDYVENDLGIVLAVKKDFDSIKYAHSASTGGEYIRITDLIGRSISLDVTAMSLEHILEEVCGAVVMPKERRPVSLITDIEKLRQIAPLFR